MDLSHCDPFFVKETPEQFPASSKHTSCVGDDHDDDDDTKQQQVHYNTTSAAAYFQELAELRTNCQKRRGVLIVRCHRQSRNAAAYAQIMNEYRERRRTDRLVETSDRFAVRFDSVTIHEFPMILGDNPACYAGPPLTIGWHPQDTIRLPVDDYESTRPPRRWQQAQMIVPAAMRNEILRRAGYGRNEIVYLTKPVNIARQNRRRTTEIQNLDALNEFGERLFRATRHVLTLGYRKRREREFLEPYVCLHAYSSNKRGDLSNSMSSTVALEISEEMVRLGNN